MTTVQSTLDSVTSVLAGSGFTDGLDSAVSSFQPITKQITDITNQVSGVFDSATEALDYVKIGVLVFFAVSIGFSVLALIGVILTAFFDKPRCRHLMYISCVFITILVLVGFLISLIFSFLAPVFYMVCGVLNNTIDTEAQFNTFINQFNVTGIDTVNALSVCFPGGNGEILVALGIAELTTLNSQINNMTTVMSDFLTYADFNTSYITDASSLVSDEIDRWYNGQTNDLVGDGPTINRLI
mgnify:CR=1 FL=1